LKWTPLGGLEQQVFVEQQVLCCPPGNIAPPVLYYSIRTVGNAAAWIVIALESKLVLLRSVGWI